MNKNLVSKATNKVTSILYNEYKKHETLVDWGEYDGINDWRWKKHYLKNIAFSLVTFALYGECMISPEAHYAQLEEWAKKSQEPKKKYRGVFAIDPEWEDHLKQMDNILCKCLHDKSINARKTILEVLESIEEIAKQMESPCHDLA